MRRQNLKSCDAIETGVPGAARPLPARQRPWRRDFIGFRKADPSGDSLPQVQGRIVAWKLMRKKEQAGLRQLHFSVA